MFKAMILLKRSEGSDFESFKTWWLKDHRPLAQQLPNLRRAVFNVVEGDGSGEFDGISELWFDSHADFDSAYKSDIGKAVAEDSMAHVARRERLFIAEHIVKDS
ncbi:EthD family reductase [Pelagibius sp. Alg239-R121]|uniref:EthD family reductase n=1 Tax=Pelagibius sp. Alg239-R121 TaxID=2993448 RepID=UPI0024A64146|nr:EthD family reductase [Pelagibius sp. Alg239-R121]